MSISNSDDSGAHIELMNLASEDLLHVGFNQDNGCLACGTNKGFIVYNVEPFRETFQRIFSSGGIGIVEMLYRCNLLAIVGGGRIPRFPTNKVMIWDDLQNRCIGKTDEIFSPSFINFHINQGELMFKSEVHAVKLRRDRIVVVLQSKVYVYRFRDLQLIDQKVTCSNPKGLISLCPDANNNILAIPGLQKGSIHIELYNISKATLIKAHDSDLSQFTLNSDGSKIASASDKGTLIRLWDTSTGELLRELRRGMDKAEIYCIAFSPTSSYLACSSDKGTVHIFSLSSNVEAGSSSAAVSTPTPVNTSRSPGTSIALSTDPSSAASNRSMNLGFLRGVLPTRFVPKYFDSEWSNAQIHGIEGKSICAFSKDSTKIFVVSSDGTFISCSFLDGGECQRVATAKIITNTSDRDEDADIIGGSASASSLSSPVPKDA